MMTANSHLPAGYALIPVMTTYLEMTDRPRSEPVAAPPGCTVEHWPQPELPAYLELFTAVGGPWGWSGRLLMSAEECRGIIQAETTEIHRLRCAGPVAGFVELDRSVGGQAEIAYFGLLAAFIGRGLGKFLLDSAMRLAWSGGTRRVRLHTCQYDHAQALAVYLKAGFRVYEERVEMQPYAAEFIRNFRPAGG